jgi:acyl-CoA thioesterase-1
VVPVIGQDHGVSRAQGWLVAGAAGVVVVLAVTFVLARARSDDQPSAGDTGPWRTVFVGDSITQGDSPSYGGRPGAGSWVRYAVEDDRSPWAFQANVAVAGQTLEQLSERFRGDVLSRGPDAVVIMGGTNDVLQGLPLADSTAALTAMVRQAQDRGARVWIVGPPPINALYGKPIEEMAAAQAVVAGTTGATYLGLGDALLGPDGDWLPELTYDGVHPTPEGAEALADAVLDALARGQ